MKQYRLLYVILLLILIVACSKDTQDKKSNEKVKTINFTDLEYKEFTIKKEKIQFVDLETTENSLVGVITKIVIRDNLIFVLDKNNNLFVFNLEGKFLNRVGHIGQGPNELYHLSHFFVDIKRKEVGIFDVIRQQVYSYDYAGNWKKKTNVGGCLSEIVNQIYCLPSGSILTSMGNKLVNYESDFNFCLYSLSDNCVKLTSYCPFGFKSNMNIAVSWSQVGENSKNTFLSPILSDSIYVLNNKGEVAGKYVFKSELKSADSFKARADFKNFAEGEKTLIKEGYSTGFSGLCATDKSLLFVFPNYTDSKYYHILWDLEKDKGYRTHHPILPFTITSGTGIYTTYKDKFVTSFQASQLLEIQKSPYAIKGHKQLDKIMSTLTEEDNPIIVLYELE